MRTRPNAADRQSLPATKPRRVRRHRRWSTAATLLTAMMAIGISPALAAAPRTLTPQQAVEAGVAAAASDGVEQYVALVDRATGKLVASSGGDHQVISESIVKLFTVAYYLVKYDGHPPSDVAADLHEMIVHSNDSIESQYWTTAAVPAMAQRYALPNTANGPKTGPHDWGWEYITANDEAKFLYEMSIDPVVGPFLMDAMENVAPVGADGFDQAFGFNSLAGEHGSKQGWTDRNTSAAINIHSVGWTGQYFGAILETSDSPQYDTMRDDSTATAHLISGLASPAQATAAADAAAQEAAAQKAAEAQKAAAQKATAEKLAEQQAAQFAVERSAIRKTALELETLANHLLAVFGLQKG